MPAPCGCARRGAMLRPQPRRAGEGKGTKGGARRRSHAQQAALWVARDPRVQAGRDGGVGAPAGEVVGSGKLGPVGDGLTDRPQRRLCSRVVSEGEHARILERWGCGGSATRGSSRRWSLPHAACHASELPEARHACTAAAAVAGGRQGGGGAPTPRAAKAGGGAAAARLANRMTSKRRAVVAPQRPPSIAPARKTLLTQLGGEGVGWRDVHG